MSVNTSRYAYTYGHVTKPDLVSTTLIYPVTIGDGVLSHSLNITGNENADAAQLAFSVLREDANLAFLIGVVGGPRIAGGEARAAKTAGGVYVAFSGASATGIPYAELPDGAGQGLRIFAGSGAVSTARVGQASSGLHRVGDWYFRGQAGANTAILYICSDAGSGVGAGTWDQVV